MKSKNYVPPYYRFVWIVISYHVTFVTQMSWMAEVEAVRPNREREQEP